MMMKDGTQVPRPLGEALSRDMYALKVFMEMSEVNQKLYVKELKNDDYGKTTRERIEKILKAICRYGEKKGIKR